MRPRSLAFRLVASSAAVACIILLAAALLLNQLFHQALERNFDARLRAVLDGVLASVELDANGSPKLPSPLTDTRFTIPLSGWYWQVTPLKLPGATDLASASLLEKRLTVPEADLNSRGADGVATFYMNDTQGKLLRAIEQRFELFDTGNEYSFVVAGDFDELKAEVATFRRTLYGVLALLGLGLLTAILLQVRFGLRPMQEMQQKLNDIRSGKAEYLEGQFPEEMQPVADEMNLVIKTGFEILDRARTQVGNLAHALKTPMSVLSNEAAAHPSPLARKVEEQTRIMRDHVNLYLDRARRAAQAGTPGAVTDVAPVIEALARTLQRIHKDKKLAINLNIAAGLQFRGERQDFEEMAGNLMDNASKWCASTVSVSAAAAPPRNGRPFFVLHVDDDGPGIPEEKRKLVLQRGQRLDEKMPGSGLGLNIVEETAALYEGALSIDASILGGARVALHLPSVAK